MLETNCDYLRTPLDTPVGVPNNGAQAQTRVDRTEAATSLTEQRVSQATGPASPGGPAGEVTRPVKASRLVRRPVGPLMLPISPSQEQKSRIFPRGLTTSRGLPMIVKSSARRRHGPARDVLRTNVPVAGQPSQRAGWGATARAGGGLPAAVADPVGPRAGAPIPVQLTGLGQLRSTGVNWA